MTIGLFLFEQRKLATLLLDCNVQRRFPARGTQWLECGTLSCALSHLKHFQPFSCKNIRLNYIRSFKYNENHQ